MHTDSSMPTGANADTQRPRSVVRALLGTATAVLASVVVSVSLTQGSLAMWTASAAVSPGPIQTGTSGLEVTASFTAADWSNLLVGESVRQSYTIANIGDVDFDLSATGATDSTSFELRTVRGTCPVTAMPGATLSSSGSALGTLAAGATTTACLEVRLASGAAPGASSAVSVTITGTQLT